MSALPPKADMDQRSCNVYFVPKADIRTTVGYDLITCLGRCSSSRGITLKLPRRHLFHLAAGGAVSLAVSRIASALDYPTRPVRLILSFPAGGPNDVVGRLLGQWLSERLGQPFVIENRSGAGGTVGTEVVVRATPDVIHSCKSIHRTRSTLRSTTILAIISFATSSQSRASFVLPSSWK